MRSARNTSVAGVAATLLAITAQGVAAQDGTTITVAQDGSGDHRTIGDAIDAATDGDTILIAPGTYVEYLEIDKDVTISGQGDRADVVIEPPEDQDERAVGSDEIGLVLIWSEGVDITLEGFTLGPRYGYGIVVKGGTALIRDISIPDTIHVREDASVTIDGSDLHRLEFTGPSETAVTDSTLRNGAFAWDGATVTYEGNEVLNGPIVAEGGASITVTGNTFAPSEDEIGVFIAEPASVGYVADNEFSGGAVGIVLEYSDESVAERNVIDGAETGIVLVESAAVARDNTVTNAGGNGIWTVGEGMTIEDNTVDGGRVGLYAFALPGEAHPEATDFETGPFVTGNSFTGASHFGVVIEDVSPELEDNTICGGREPLRIEGDASPTLGDNEICEAEESGS
jgi:hypothetical protein